jgi:hypothetical protein
MMTISVQSEQSKKNGGILENVISGPDLDKPKRRYWFDGSLAVLTQPVC